MNFVYLYKSINTNLLNCVIRNNLELKYLTSREYYNTKVINDIIYNENTHIVSVFKDYLIYDDVSEFLKRQYHVQESKKRLPKVIEFYETYSKVFPNYVNLPENKFMFKNIERKQLYWDSKQQFLMEQEERNAKKKARIEDFGGVQNAPSSFFNESIDDRLFSNSWVDEVNNMKTLPDKNVSFVKIVTLKDEYDSQVGDLSRNEGKKSIVKQFEEMINSFAKRDTSTIGSNSVLELSELSKNLTDESFFKAKINDHEVSDFFKKTALKSKEKEMAKQNQKINSKLHQYKEYNTHMEKHPEPSVNPYKKNIMKNENAIELISNHYNGKVRLIKQHNSSNGYEKSTKPGSENKIIVNSGTLIKHLRTTDSSDLVAMIKNRDSSEKKNIRPNHASVALLKVSPFKSIGLKKSTSQYRLKPKLKIVKNKDPKPYKKIRNPFKKPYENDFSSKHSGISPNSRMKTSDIYKEKKGRKKGHKRMGSHTGKSYHLLGRSQTAINDNNKSIKILCDTLQQTHRPPLVIKNLFSQQSLKSQIYGSGSRKRKDGHKDQGFLKNLINKNAILPYRDATKKLEIKNKQNCIDLLASSLKYIQGSASNVKISNPIDNDAYHRSGKKENKGKGSFHRPSLSVCFDQLNGTQ